MITAMIYQRKLFFRKQLVTKATVSLLPSLEATPVGQISTASVGIPFSDDKGTHYTAQLTVRINPPTIQKYSFKVNIGTFHSQDHASRHLSNPQLMLSPSDLAKKVLPCSAATQSVLDWRQEEAFKYRIVHSSVGLISAVEIINLYQQVVASAHTINSNSLPEIENVKDVRNCIVLNQAEGERAMLIRGRKDWGVCVGKWQQQIKPRFQSAYRFGPNFVNIRFFKLFGKQGWCVVKKAAFGTFVIRINSNTVIRLDLRKSKIYVSPNAQDIPEAVALALSVAVLHLLCIPYLPKRSVEASPDYQVSSRSPITSPIFRVVGYSCRTVPTNTYIKHVLGEQACAVCGGTGEVACYDFNKDLVCDFNVGPTSGNGGSAAWEDLAVGENNDHEVGGDGSFGHGGLCVGADAGDYDSAADACVSGAGSVCASGGCVGGDGGGCGGGNGGGGGADSGGGGGCGGADCGGGCGGD